MERMVTEALERRKPALALEGWSFDPDIGLLINDQMIEDAISRLSGKTKTNVRTFLRANPQQSKFVGLEHSLVHKANGPHFHILRFFLNANDVKKNARSDKDGMSIGETTKDIIKAGKAAYMAIGMLRTGTFPGFLAFYNSRPDLQSLESSYYESFVAKLFPQYTTDQWQNIFTNDEDTFRSLGKDVRQIIETEFKKIGVPDDIASKYLARDRAIQLKKFGLTESPVEGEILDNYVLFGMTYRNYAMTKSILQIQGAATKDSSIDVIMHNDHAIGIESMIKNETLSDPKEAPRVKIIFHSVCK